MYQKLTIVGNLGRDPEMRYLPSGQAVTNMSVATNNTFTKNGEKVTETTWFRVSVWGKSAENCNTYLKQGSRVLIEGRLTPDPDTGNPRIWSRADGSPGTNYDMTAFNVLFLSKVESTAGYQEQQQDDFPVDIDQADEIPF